MKHKLTILFALITFFSIAQIDSTIIGIDNYLSKLDKSGDFHLAIAIQKNDSIVYTNAFGYANREHKVPNTPNTKFNIASIGKMFTAVEILKLKQDNKLELSETVGKYIPDFPHEAIKDSVTIEELLTHSSGLPLWFSDEFESNSKFQYKQLKDYLPLFENVKIDYTKKGNNHYSNVGFFVLGYIIEAVQKQSFRNSINKDIVAPNKLIDTDVWNLSSVINNSAVGYTRPIDKSDTWKTNYHVNMGGSPAGGFHSSVIDLLKFYSALRNHKILDIKHTELMFKPHIKTGYGSYGYGVGISENNGKEIIGHLGGFYGVRGELMRYKDTDYTIAILSNTDQTDYADISYFVKILLTGTDKEKSAYLDTHGLIKDIVSGVIVYDTMLEEGRTLDTKRFDENLIQIKAYHYLNNKQYDKAKVLFELNNSLFPNSKRAAADLMRLKDE